MRPLRTFSLDPRTIEILETLGQDTGYKLCRIVDMLVMEKAIHCQDHKLLSFEKMTTIMSKNVADYNKRSFSKKPVKKRIKKT